MNTLSRRRLWPSFLLHLLLLFLSQSGLDGAGPKDVWDIQGPVEKKCLAEGVVGGDELCADESAVLALRYGLHAKAQNAVYQIFQKDCKEYFEKGTEPLRGIETPWLETPLSRSPAPEGGDATVAWLEILVAERAFSLASSPWWYRLSGIKAARRTVEFCVRVSLWTSLDEGKLEINYRETNVAMTFDKKTTEEGEDRYFLNQVVLDTKAAAKGSSSGEEKVEL